MSNTRDRLPTDRSGVTIKTQVGGLTFYVILGFYPDHRLGEVFVRFDKRGNITSGLIEAWCIAVSLGLQYGVPWETFARHFTGMKFAPFDREASSIIDKIATVITAACVEQQQANLFEGPKNEFGTPS